MTVETEAVPADRIGRIGRDRASAIAEAEYALLLDAVRGLEASDWAKPTDCADWDVRAMVAHLAGATAACGSPFEFIRQAVRGSLAVRRTGRPMVDGINLVQVRERHGKGSRELLDELEDNVPKAVRGRRRIPGAIRRIRVPDPVMGRLSLGFLNDVVYTRDSWMHRVDLSRATGHPMELTPEHDGVIVADVVAEWAGRHGREFRLILDGPAGGTFFEGDGGPDLTVDAVEFCRIVSGRAPGEGLLATLVLF